MKVYHNLSYLDIPKVYCFEIEERTTFNVRRCYNFLARHEEKFKDNLDRISIMFFYINLLEFDEIKEKERHGEKYLDFYNKGQFWSGVPATFEIINVIADNIFEV